MDVDCGKLFKNASSIKMENTAIHTTTILGLKLVSTQFDKVLSWLFSRIESEDSLQNGCILVGTPNPEQLVLTRKDRFFDTTISHLDLLLPDGTGLIWAAKFLSARWGTQALSQRLTGIDVTTALLSQLHGMPEKKVIVIGGRGLGQGTPSDWLERLPGLHLLAELHAPTLGSVSSRSWYWLEGYVDVSQPTSEEEMILAEVLGQVQPALVLVALGAPWQEQWLVNHRAELSKAGVAVAMAVGGTFDVLAGQLPRAPLWMRRLGLEWLFRLYKEPWRWRRQVALLEFIWITVKALVKKAE